MKVWCRLSTFLQMNSLLKKTRWSSLMRKRNWNKSHLLFAIRQVLLKVWSEKRGGFYCATRGRSRYDLVTFPRQLCLEYESDLKNCSIL